MINNKELISFWASGNDIFAEAETEMLLYRMKNEEFSDDVPPEVVESMRKWEAAGPGEEAGKQAMLVKKHLGLAA